MGTMISAVMITRNRREEACRSVERLLALDEAPRVIVVDNGSSDGTAAALAANFAGIEVHRVERNLGAAGRNLGVALAPSEFVAFCDDDTMWLPGSLGLAVERMARAPRLAVVNARVVVHPSGATDPACEEMAASPLRARALSPGVPILGFMAGASVVRRSAFLGVGGFDHRFGVGGEEELVAIDLASQGWDLSYFDDVVVRHEPSAERDRSRRAQRQLRNAVWTACLRRPLPAVAARCRLVRSASCQDRRRVWTSVAAGLPSVARHRRVISPDLEGQLRLLEAPAAG